MVSGNIILLNGTSSSGKTSIARELQYLMEEPYLFAGTESFLAMLPPRYIGEETPADECFFWKKCNGGLDIQIGEKGHALISGMHNSIAALAATGNNVIVDHLLKEKRWLKECVETLEQFNVFFIAVHCPLEIAEKRELARGDRRVGQTRFMYNLIHENKIYDFEVDSSDKTPRECALQVKKFVNKNNEKPDAFTKLMKMIES